VTSSTANAPATAIPNSGQTASDTTKAPVAPASATEGQSTSGQPQPNSASKPSTPVFGDADGAAQPEATEAAKETPLYTLESVKDFDAYDSLLPSVAKVAHGLKLPQETAQKLFAQLAPALRERETQQAKEMHESWIEGTRKDPEIGGAKLEATRKGANAALDKVGTEALKELLIASNLKDNVEILRLFHRINALTGADTVESGTGGKPDTEPPIEVGWNARTAKTFYGKKG